MTGPGSTETGRQVALLLADEERGRLLETLLSGFGYQVIRAEDLAVPQEGEAANLYAAVVDADSDLLAGLGESCRGGVVVLGGREQPPGDPGEGRVVSLSREADPAELLTALRRLAPEDGGD